MEKNPTKLSILMFPWLAHGHIFPFLELAKKLSNQNFQIYYLSTPINLASIKTTLATTSSTFGVPIRLVELNLPCSPELPPESHTTKNTPPHLMPKLQEAFHQSQPEFFTIISSLKPDLIIYDCFQPWAASSAASLGIPAVHFAVSSAVHYAYSYHRYATRDTPFPYNAVYLLGYQEKAFKHTITGKLIAADDRESGFPHFKLTQEIVLIKTSRSLEDKYIDYLSLLSQKTQITVGSLIIPPDDDNDSNYNSMIMQWLSKKKRYSTVFISVGSENYMSKNQMQEIAKGLEISKVNFIWAMRFPRGERVENMEEALPEGFLERTRERGMIVEWAPQDRILAHPSVGAFVSHCGWNSALESIHFGVPLVGIPFKFDQPLNVKMMVEHGVAVELVRDEDGDLISCEDFADAMNKVVGGEMGEVMREKAAVLSEKMRSEEETAISEAARLLRRICLERKQKN